MGRPHGHAERRHGHPIGNEQRSESTMAEESASVEESYVRTEYTLLFFLSTSFLSVHCNGRQKII